MGRIVNRPGASRHADIGIALFGTGESPAAPAFIDGRKAATLRGPQIAHAFQTMGSAYIERCWGKGEGDRGGGVGGARSQPSGMIRVVFVTGLSRAGSYRVACFPTVDRSLAKEP